MSSKYVLEGGRGGSEHFKLRRALPSGDIASAVLCCLPLLVMFCTVPIRREDVAEWANREAELTSGLHAPVGPSSWEHNYIIYLKMFYDIRAKWEGASDPEKLQQLYRQMNK